MGAVNVQLNFTANTSAAKKNIDDLQHTLSQISAGSAGSKDLFGSATTHQIQEASAAALQLKQSLAKCTDVTTGKLNLASFNADLAKAGTSVQQLQQSLLAAGSAGMSAFTQLNNAIIQSTNKANSLFNKNSQIMRALTGALANQIADKTLQATIGSISSAYSYAQRLDTSLNNIRIVTGQSADQMKDFAVQANKAAQSLSTTTTQYTDAALIFYQQGLKGKDVTERTDTVVKLSNVTGESAQQVSEQLTAIWNNFDDYGDNFERYADIITALGATTASSSAEIAEGLGKFAAIAKTTGLSYDYATSALATLVSATRQSADTVGTSLKTLFSRLQGLQLGDTLEDGVDLNKYSGALAKVGVQALDASGQMRDLDTILEDLAGRWGDLTDAQKMALAQTVAGVRQYNVLISLMDNWDKMQKNLDTAAGASGKLQEQQEIYEESWTASQKRLKAAMESIYDTLIDEDFFISLTNIGTYITKGVDSAIQSLGGLKGVIFGLLSIINTTFAPKVAAMVDGTIEKTKMMFTSKADQKAQKEQFVQDNVQMYKQYATLNYGQDSFKVENMSQAYGEIARLQTSYVQISSELSTSQKGIVEGLMQQQQLLSQNVEKRIEETEASEQATEGWKAYTKGAFEHELGIGSSEVNPYIDKNGNYTEAALQLDPQELTAFESKYGSSTLDDMINEYEKLNRVAGEADQAARTLQQSISKIGQGDTAANIENIKQQFEQFTKDFSRDDIFTAFGDSAAQAFDKVQQAMQNGDPSEISKAWEQFYSQIVLVGKNSDISTPLRTMKDDIVQFAEICGQSEQGLAEFNEGLTKMGANAQVNGRNIRQTAEAQEVLSASTDEAIAHLEQFQIKNQSIGSSFAALAGKMSTLAMSLSTIGGSFDTLTDASTSASQKIVAGLTLAATAGRLYAVVTDEGTTKILANIGAKAAQIAIEHGLTTATLTAAAAQASLNAEILIGLGIFAGVVVLVGALIWLFVSLTKAEENRIKKIKKANEAYQEEADKLQQLEDKLSGINDKIDELNSKGPLTLIEQSELNKLEQERAATEALIAAQEKVAQAKLEATNQAMLNHVDKTNLDNYRPINLNDGINDEDDLETYNERLDNLNNYIESYGNIIKQFGIDSKQAAQVRDFIIKYQKKAIYGEDNYLANVVSTQVERGQQYLNDNGDVVNKKDFNAFLKNNMINKEDFFAAYRKQIETNKQALKDTGKFSDEDLAQLTNKELYQATTIDISKINGIEDYREALYNATVDGIESGTQDAMQAFHGLAAQFKDVMKLKPGDIVDSSKIDVEKWFGDSVSKWFSVMEDGSYRLKPEVDMSKFYAELANVLSYANTQASNTVADSTSNAVLALASEIDTLIGGMNGASNHILTSAGESAKVVDTLVGQTIQINDAAGETVEAIVQQASDGTIQLVDAQSGVLLSSDAVLTSTEQLEAASMVVSGEAKTIEEIAGRLLGLGSDQIKDNNGRTGIELTQTVDDGNGGTFEAHLGELSGEYIRQQSSYNNAMEADFVRNYLTQNGLVDENAKTTLNASYGKGETLSGNEQKIVSDLITGLITPELNKALEQSTDYDNVFALFEDMMAYSNDTDAETSKVIWEDIKQQAGLVDNNGNTRNISSVEDLMALFNVGNLNIPHLIQALQQLQPNLDNKATQVGDTSNLAATGTSEIQTEIETHRTTQAEVQAQIDALELQKQALQETMPKWYSGGDAWDAWNAQNFAIQSQINDAKASLEAEGSIIDQLQNQLAFGEFGAKDFKPTFVLPEDYIPITQEGTGTPKYEASENGKNFVEGLEVEGQENGDEVKKLTELLIGGIESKTDTDFNIEDKESMSTFKDFMSGQEGLNLLSELTGITDPSQLTELQSQYIQFFTNILDGVIAENEKKQAETQAMQTQLYAKAGSVEKASNMEGFYDKEAGAATEAGVNAMREMASATAEGREALQEYNAEMKKYLPGSTEAIAATKKFEKTLRTIEATKVADNISKIIKSMAKMTEEAEKTSAYLEISEELESIFGGNVTSKWVKNNMEVVEAWMKGGEAAEAAAQKIELAAKGIGPENWGDVSSVADWATQQFGLAGDQAATFADNVVNCGMSVLEAINGMNGLRVDVDGTADFSSIAAACDGSAESVRALASYIQGLNLSNVAFTINGQTIAPPPDVLADPEAFVAWWNSNIAAGPHADMTATGSWPTDTPTPNMSRGGSGGGGGGGGGGKQKNKDKKEADAKDRYHTINEQIEDLTNSINKLSTAEDRAFGVNKVKTMYKELTKLNKQVENYNKKLEEAQQYMAKDSAEAEKYANKIGMTVQKGANGEILNWDELKSGYLNWYNQKVDQYNAGGIDDDTFSEEVEKEYTKAMEAFDQYEETNNLIQELEQNILETKQAYEDMLLAIQKEKLEIQIQVDENGMKLLEYFFEKLNNDLYDSVDRMSILEDEMANLVDQASAYESNINGILETAGEWKNGANNESTFEQYGLTLDDLPELLQKTPKELQQIFGGDESNVQEIVDQLQNDYDNLLEVNSNLIETREKLIDEIGISFEAWNEQIDKFIDKIEANSSLMEHYRNVIEIVGRKTLGITSGFIRDYNFKQVKNDIATLSAEYAQLNEMRAKASQLEQAILKETSEDTRYLMQKELDDMNDAIQEQAEQTAQAWEDAMRGIQEAYEDTIQVALDDWQTKMAGLAGSADMLKLSFDMATDLDDNYLDDYDKIYELTKLTNDINKSIDETDNLKSKEDLIELMEKVNELNESDAEISQYTVDILNARYDLLLAEQALKEAQNAKSTVRMTQDNEGNWGYVYTADEDKIQQAEQEYADKLHALEEINQNYLDDLDEKLANLSADASDKIMAIVNDSTLSLEEKREKIQEVYEYTNEMEQFLMEQTQIALKDAMDIYDQDARRYSDLTGSKMLDDEKWVNSFEEMKISQITGFEELEDWYIAFADSWEKTCNEIENTTDEFVELNREAFETVEMDIDNAAEEMGEDLNDIANNTEEVRESIIDMANSAEEEIGRVIDYAATWSQAWSDEIDKIIAKNELLAKSCDQIIQKLADVQALEQAQKEAELEEEKESKNFDKINLGNLNFNQSSSSSKSSGCGTCSGSCSGGCLNSCIGGGNNAIKSDQKSGSCSATCTGSAANYSDTKAVKADTGMYTGEWPNGSVRDNGKLAFLHQKELVLNEHDTENFLDAIEIVRNLNETLDLRAMSMSKGLGNLSIAGLKKDIQQSLDQNVAITAEFPNVKDRNEIEQAFNNLINRAAQYANRKR